jgi:hypothetical protein
MKTRLAVFALVALLVGIALIAFAPAPVAHSQGGTSPDSFDSVIRHNAQRMLSQGRHTFRFDTFGDEAFWGDTLQLHKAIEGRRFGGVGPGVTPRQALALGLKVDVEALPPSFCQQLRSGKVNLDDTANTLFLLKNNAVLGLTGFFNHQGTLQSIGIQCALCHSTVDNSCAFGVGNRLDGWANRDLNVGAIVADAPNLQPVAKLLGTKVDTVKKVLNAWGPGKFDAELLLDGKGFRPDGTSAATLLPNAYGLAGFNQHTWTGAWGTVTYWNAFVANIEMHGQGVFFDPRLNNATQFPIAAKAGFGNIRTAPDSDRITKKLAGLHFYQLAIPSPRPRPDADFDNAAAARGDVLFEGKARCNTCHVEPLWTEPGWNLHTPQEMGIDDFEANRAPNGVYKTMNLAGLFVRERGLFMNPANKGRYYHDGRFATLLDVVRSYNTRFNLGLTDQEQSDLVEYLKSLFSNGSAVAQ